MTDAAAPTIDLPGGASIPALGLGTWPLDDDEAATAVEQAVAAGYRLFDTAENYGNEAGVGEGIRRSGIERDQVFITTKFNKKWHSVDGVRRAFEQSAAKLGVDYIDLLLVHWPNPDQDRYLDAVKGLVSLREEGLLKAIGVSNFKPHHLQRLLDDGLVPDVNQVQLDPRHTRADSREFHAQHGIVTESWSPLGKGGNLLQDPAVDLLADKYGMTPAQIVLRWHLQLGLVAIPKSANPLRIKQNINLFGFELTQDEVDSLSALDTGDDDITDSDSFGH
ncbi:2,5-diketo-D-gluconate reductase A [Arthrobacter pigmenti]|uniref:2,5-diketo-D-gluconate reductase A n=1 Tax=Arthrobacter pigmenti TaxID=271432 RepID=A0A846RKL7_9MICC|nr:aldo/keto reductase [Arthrobacter pigmenti]NJC23773.1 2,5-diketo-D-gluconate reductase A [Arthrobacter pigmenti]